MSRPRILACLALLWFVVSAGPAPAAPAEGGLSVVTRDVSAYPDVRVVVAVPAQMGDGSHKIPAITLMENGEARPVRVELLLPDQIKVALVIDTSASMAGAGLTAAKQAARTFLGDLPATASAVVIAFGSSSTVVSPRSTDRPAQMAAVDALVAGGETPVYDALGLALSQLPATGARPMAVLVTDGDATSSASLDATADAMVAAKVPLFAIDLNTNGSNPAALNRLTSAAGGHLVVAADPAELAGALNAVGKQLVRQYAVTYRSQSNGPIDIELGAELNGLRAGARPHLDLPAAPVPITTAPPVISDPSATTEVAPLPTTVVAPVADAGNPATAGSSVIGDWALLLGAALCGVALLGLLLGYATSWTPQARGLAPRRRQEAHGLKRVTDRAASIGEGLLRRRGGFVAITRSLELAGLDIRPGDLLLGLMVGFVVLLGIGWFLFAPVIGLVLALLVPLVARVVLRVLTARRRQKFSDQLAETLQILAGSLRAGHGLAQSIDTVAREADRPTSDEFGRLTLESRLGRDFVEALGGVSERVGSEDFQWVVQAVEIQREVGGDLAAILDTVGSTVRDRTRIRRQVSALSAEGRLSAWVLMILPFGLGAMMAVTNRGYLSPLFSSGTGLKLLVVAAALLVAGGFWLRQIVKPTF